MFHGMKLKSSTSANVRHALVITILVAGLSLAFQARKGLNLWDEGFLWYGVQRVLMGEVPLRDFMSYDPGRYYWGAAILSLIGDSGIISLRWALAAFQGLGLFFALCLIAYEMEGSKKKDFVFLLLCAIALVFWMFPRHKLFDISISIFLIALITFLVRKPVPLRYFSVGLGVGFIAIFGRNHGVYGLLACSGAALWVAYQAKGEVSLGRAICLLGSGIIVGYLPLILMVAFVPGFAASFWESVWFLFEQKATNITLPIPWPWTVDPKSLSTAETVRFVVVGLLFIGVAAFAAASLGWVVIKGKRGERVSPVLVAAAFLAVPYAHYAYSRADVGHLAQGIFPLLVGCLIAISSLGGAKKWLLVGLLTGGSIWITHIYHPGWVCRAGGDCVSVQVGGDRLTIEPNTASGIDMMRRLVNELVPEGQVFIVTPFWPGIYAVMNTRSPLHGIYMTLPQSSQYQQREINRISELKPQLIVVMDIGLDGRDDLRFRNAQPEIYDFIVRNFNAFDADGVPDQFRIFTGR